MADQQRELGFDEVSKLTRLPNVCTGQQLAERETKYRSRHSDPDTSREAEMHIVAKLGRLKREVLAVADQTPRTARELAELASKKSQGEVESYRKRARELCRLGYLKEMPPHKCAHTGRNAATYIRVI